MTTSTAAPEQRQLFATGRDETDAVVVNDRVAFRTRNGHRVALVDGLGRHHYAVEDRVAEAYAMVTLVESWSRTAGRTSWQRTATSWTRKPRGSLRLLFYGARWHTLRRHEDRFDGGGIEAPGRAPGRPTSSRTRGKHAGRRDRAVPGMKAEGLGNCEIARRLGVTEKAVRKRLNRLGWIAPDRQGRLFPGSPPAAASAASAERAVKELARGEPVGDKRLPSVAANPLDRSSDLLFARLGLLDDAEPIFAPARNVARAGGLLAVPSLVKSGVVEIARSVYGERALAPAFYGLRMAMVALDNPEARRPTPRGFKIAHGKVGRPLRAALESVAALKRERAALSERVPVSEALGGAPVVKLAAERKHLTNVLKMVAYQIESDLVELLRPHHARVDDEGRTLLHTALLSAADLAPSADRLDVTLAPLSSAYRSRAVAAVCEELNRTETRFPGSRHFKRHGVPLAPAES